MLTHNVIVITKSTVPVGTNELVHSIIQENLLFDWVLVLNLIVNKCRLILMD
ncbi:hypothetical protein JN080_14450 [Bacillus sp. EB600]|nr:hypothetical protein [Bacillus sp. EB600]